VGPTTAVEWQGRGDCGRGHCGAGAPVGVGVENNRWAAHADALRSVLAVVALPSSAVLADWRAAAPDAGSPVRTRTDRSSVSIIRRGIRHLVGNPKPAAMLGDGLVERLAGDPALPGEQAGAQGILADAHDIGVG